MDLSFLILTVLLSTPKEIQLAQKMLFFEKSIAIAEKVAVDVGSQDTHIS